MSHKVTKPILFIQGLLARLKACRGTKKKKEEVKLTISQIVVSDDDTIRLTLEVEYKDPIGVKDFALDDKVSGKEVK